MRQGEPDQPAFEVARIGVTGDGQLGETGDIEGSRVRAGQAQVARGIRSAVVDWRLRSRLHASQLT
ncbi:MAG: hypothetical protein ACHP9Z_09660 [Streptosporangiales bacterium]